MSTTTQCTIDQKPFNLFLQLIKPATFTCFSADGALYLSDGDSTLMLGDYDGDDVSIRCGDGKKLAKYVRSAKVGAVIGVSVEDDTLVLRCDRLGEMAFVGNPWSYGNLPLNALGEYQAELDAETVGKVAALASRCREEQRYSLNAVCFENMNAVATDGRRLAVHEIPTVGLDNRFLVLDAVVKMAAKLGEEIIFNAGRCVVGQSIHRYVDGGYPDWQGVIPETDTSMPLDGDVLREQCKQAKNRAKIENQARDEYKVAIDLIDDIKVLLDFEFVLDAVGKLKDVTIAWDSSDGAVNDGGNLVRPVVLTSDEAPEWFEVIMPKSY